MNTWWTSLTPTMQILWGITLTATLIFIIQSIMTFMGLGDSGADADFDVPDDVGADIAHDGTGLEADPGMNLLTFRNFVNFFLGFGWSAILLRDSISSNALLYLISGLVGIALVAAVMWMFKWLYGMQQSGNIDLNKSAVGCQGQTYLTIPGERSGTGKVQITIQGAVREYEAITDGDAIKTGTPIKVMEVINNTILLVEELQSGII